MSQRNTNWLFTINNPETNTIPEQWTESVKYCIWQLERGEQGTPHLQGYLQLKQRQRLSYLKKLDSHAHWEVRRGTHQEAVEYCSKEDTRQEGPWTYGTPTMGQGQRSDLQALKKALEEGKTERDIATNEELFPSWLRYHRAIEKYQLLTCKQRDFPTHTTVYYGPPGVGKSSRALLEGGTDSFWLAKPASKQGSLWWDGYTGQKVVVIDEFYGWISRDLMCRMCDRYPLNVERKGGSCIFRPERIIITSNQHPKDWWKCGLGPMERRLTPPLGEIIEMPGPPALDPPVGFLCSMCGTERVGGEGDLCDNCFPPLQEIWLAAPEEDLDEEDVPIPDSPTSLSMFFDENGNLLQ